MIGISSVFINWVWEPDSVYLLLTHEFFLQINPHPLQEDECFKINTGAPLPKHADCVVQVEDTKLLQRDKYGGESLVEILVEPKAGQDVR